MLDCLNYSWLKFKILVLYFNGMCRDFYVRLVGLIVLVLYGVCVNFFLRGKYRNDKSKISF